MSDTSQLVVSIHEVAEKHAERSVWLKRVAERWPNAVEWDGMVIVYAHELGKPDLIVAEQYPDGGLQLRAAVNFEGRAVCSRDAIDAATFFKVLKRDTGIYEALLKHLVETAY